MTAILLAASGAGPLALFFPPPFFISLVAGLLGLLVCSGSPTNRFTIFRRTEGPGVVKWYASKKRARSKSTRVATGPTVPVCPPSRRGKVESRSAAPRAARRKKLGRARGRWPEAQAAGSRAAVRTQQNGSSGAHGDRSPPRAGGRLACDPANAPCHAVTPHAVRTVLTSRLLPCSLHPATTAASDPAANLTGP